MTTIDQEASNNSSLPLNLDNFSQRCTTENGLYTFPSPSLETIDKNLFYLLVNSTTIPFDPKYKYRPATLSWDQYGTIVLDKLLLYVNAIFLVEDFDLDTVIVPSFQSIINILVDKFNNSNTSNFPEVNW